MPLPSIPTVLEGNIRAVLKEETDSFFEAWNTPELTAIRLNPGKIIAGDIFHGSYTIPWEKQGRWLPERPSFTYDPHWHAGAYYVQESSSMFTGYLLKRAGLFKKSLIALDACAAPGGKSTQLLSNMATGSLLVANEVIPKRNRILVENLIRWGNPNIVVTQAELYEFRTLPCFFDLVVLDAPCSGEGMMRRDPAVIKQWSKKTVENCAIRQSRLIRDIVSAIKPGGYLLYSTCTYEPDENENQIELLLSLGFSQSHDLHDAGDAFKDITTIPVTHSGKTVYAQRFDLHKTNGSGFFCCLLQKEKENEKYNYSAEIKARNTPMLINKPLEPVNKWVNNISEFVQVRKFNDLFLLPEAQYHRILSIYNVVKCTYQGIETGHLKGDILVPAHALALSMAMSKETPHLEVNQEAAIAYLKKLPLDIDITNNDGWVLLRYNGLGLGWIKVITGGRINNYLPAEWRILR